MDRISKMTWVNTVLWLTLLLQHPQHIEEEVPLACSGMAH